MLFVYAKSEMTPKRPDEFFQEEAEVLANAGHSISLIDVSRLANEPARILPAVAPEAEAVYRGWMLTAPEYSKLMESVAQSGGYMQASLEQYLATHHLPNWYPLLTEFTPRTVWFDVEDDLVSRLRELNWKRYFIKDYVKSLKTSVGSMIESPEQIETVVAEMSKFRGMIEGGICVREVEALQPETERRFFVLYGQPYVAENTIAIPDPVHECAKRINSPFFSVDVAKRADGVERIVEIGDGQVSDLVGWTVERFKTIWQSY
jgi:hypothetical protein